MRLAAPADRGEWFTFTTDDHGERAEFQIRRIPASVDRRIEADVLGIKRQVKFKRGAQILDYEVDRSQEITFRKAVYALVESRGAELPVADVPLLAHAGEGTITGAGAFATLDGHWTDEVKRQVFDAFPPIALWVVEKAQSLDARAREDEEGKGGTS